MSASAKYAAQYNTVIFVESAPGVFSHFVGTYGNASLSSSGDTMMAVAIATDAGYGVSGWSVYNGATSGYPSGPFLVTQGNRTSYNAQKPNTASTVNYYGCKVTVEDAHGSHVGTPTMSGKYVVPSASVPGAVAVRHKSASIGWAFAGWRVTRKPYYSGNSYTMAYLEILSGAAGETEGLVTFYPAAALGDSALVIKIPYKVDSTLDELIVEAVYVDATKCTLSFDANADDAEAPAIPDVVIGIGMSGRLPTPGLWKRLGYSFSHWNTAADGSGESYEANAVYTPVEGSYLVTMYAQWTKQGGEGGAQSQHYVGDDGKSAGSSYYNPYALKVSVSGLADSAGAVTVAYQTRNRSYSSTTRMSYDSGTGKTTTTTTQNSESGPTVNATFRLDSDGGETNVSVPGTYTSYESRWAKNYGSQGSWVREITRSYCSTDTSWQWEAPEIPGYDFEGWYTLDRSYFEDDPPTAYIYSTLISKSPKITWGELVKGLNRYRSYFYVDYDEVLYHFETNTNYLRLVYRGKTLRVTFRAEGGELDDIYREVRRLEVYGDMPVPSRPGHTFAGWYTARDGGELVTEDTVVSALEDHTLYAQWTRNPVTITVHFVGCGGEVEPTEKTVESGAAYGELPTPVRDGYEFKGWYTASLGGILVSAETIVGQTYTHWLYAQWKQIKKPSGGGSAGMFKVS